MRIILCYIHLNENISYKIEKLGNRGLKTHERQERADDRRIPFNAFAHVHIIHALHVDYFDLSAMKFRSTILCFTTDLHLGESEYHAWHRSPAGPP